MENDVAYLERRIAQQEERVTTASHAAARRAHQQLLSGYRQRLLDLAVRPIATAQARPPSGRRDNSRPTAAA
ncbi:hypothetical protein HMF7854_00355 [Sphingomonas ginkgonis]|uniref:Uncharacterized protein n=1 Tax=Sphingomonas ginkgonis TaxID=2315330 RepID=A0A3R9WQN3_9SPHN|nr:hypothetical protein [Sphingomonas ginkgonis]RST29451.1 hypothetical protein HMF7854_00355 [Sphingomonas ginkgonis]